MLSQSIRLQATVAVSGILLASSLVLLACSPARPDRADDSGPIAERLDELIERYARLGRFSGAVAVVSDGALLFARGYGLADRGKSVPIGPRTRFSLASLSKQFTAAAILKLEAEGRLRVEDAISVHLPDYPRPQGDRVTIHHLLSHTSGIPSLWRLGDGLEAIEATAKPVSSDRLLDFFQDRELLFEPGERFRYSNSGYVVLATIIQAVSGRPYEDYLEEALFRPLGMNDTGCRTDPADAVAYRGYAPVVEPAPVEHPSWSIGDGCVHSTLLDLVKWDKALREDTFLPEPQRQKLLAPHAARRSGGHYGYGWFLSQRHGRPVAHHGGEGEGVIAEMHRFADDLSIVALANYAPRLGVSAPADLVDRTAAMFFGLPVELPPAVVEMSPDRRTLVSGRYSMAAGGTLEISVDGEHLFVEPDVAGRLIFDFGMLADPSVFEAGGELARKVLASAAADDFSAIPVCESLRQDLAPDELRDEWRNSLGGRGKLLEATTALTTRYPGEDTLIIVSRLDFESGATFFSLDLTPSLEVCGWYGMDPAEFEIRRSLSPPTLVPLMALSSGELLADGFNYGEQDVRLSFRGEDRMVLTLRGAVEHSGVKVDAAGLRAGGSRPLGDSSRRPGS